MGDKGAGGDSVASRYRPWSYCVPAAPRISPAPPAPLHQDAPRLRRGRATQSQISRLRASWFRPLSRLRGPNTSWSKHPRALVSHRARDLNSSARPYDACACSANQRRALMRAGARVAMQSRRGLNRWPYPVRAAADIAPTTPTPLQQDAPRSWIIRATQWLISRFRASWFRPPSRLRGPNVLRVFVFQTLRACSTMRAR